MLRPLLFLVAFMGRSSKSDSESQTHIVDQEKGRTPSPDIVLNMERDSGDDGDGDEADDNRESHNEKSSNPLSRVWTKQSSKGSVASSSDSTFAVRTHFKWFYAIKHFILQTGPFDDPHHEFIPNYRWTPIISGIAVPFAILLEIPGLTDHWYQPISGPNPVAPKSNPPILIAGIAISMISAILANASLIVRYLEKRPREMTIIAIASLTIHDLLNVICMAAFAANRKHGDGFQYGQAYWLTVASTVVSTLTNCTLIYDFRVTPFFSKSGSGLTRKQRSLVVIVMILLCWIALGAVVYSAIMNLNYVDGLYFTVVSIETIGFGDIHPTGTSSRIFAIFYNTIGLLMLGMAISMCRETVIESFEHSYHKRAKLLAEKHQEHKLARVARRARRIAVERQLRAAGLPAYIDDPHHHHPHVRKRSKSVLNDGALSEEQTRKALDEADFILQKYKEGHDHHVNELEQEHDGEDNHARTIHMAEELEEELLSTRMGRVQEQSYQRVKRQLEHEQSREFYIKLIVAWTLFFVFWLIGGVIFSQTENWSYGLALYFCYITFSTIGYGDYFPVTAAGRSIFIVYALLGVATMTIFISVVSEACSSKYHSVVHSTHFHRAVRKFRDRRRKARTLDLQHDPTTVTVTGTLEQPDASISPDEERARIIDRLQELPTQLLIHVRSFHEHVHYLLDGVQLKEPPPQSLCKLLEEIADGASMPDRLKKEILADEESRKMLFMISYENAMRKMIETVEFATSVAVPVAYGDTPAESRSVSPPPLCADLDDEQKVNFCETIHELEEEFDKED
ncbi:voltage-gated potassium channel [Sistotremastrum niveocremeum HHB9708]|uniref:Voltage-gated potassium channel n=1 Tax=Sistotremastrum niveocremeum HHB9708 TaxID=1314777 RepID=A0A164YY54_9AGAM|nr:voltage-gated potassium channel [Sistotremastrum niveocremeum HHB9708]